MADRALVGMGGWLALFAFGAGAIAPLRIVRDLTEMMTVDDGAAAAQYGGLWTFILSAEWAIGVLTIAFCWFIVWRLLKVERWSTVRIVIAGTWFIGLGRGVIEMLLWSLLLDSGEVIEELGPGTVGGFFYGVIWTAYFLRSRRVANSYRREAAHEEMVGIFS